MNRTANYNLCQFEPGDQVQRTDFNADNAKLDAALKAAEQRSAGLDTKINATAAAAEQRSAAVAAAAEQRSAAVAAAAEQRSAAVAAAAEKRSAALDAAKGNCTIEFFSYVGQGRSGSTFTPTTITFREPPLFFLVFGTYSIGVGSKHSSNVVITARDNVFPDKATWSGNTISFSNNDPRWQLDTEDEIFYVFAFYTAG